MQAIEFETDITGNVIEIPEEYKGLRAKHVKVIVLVEEPAPKYNFSDLAGKLNWSGNELSEQRKLRNEW